MRYIPETCRTTKTYATEAKADDRAKKLLADMAPNEAQGQTYIIMMADNGRYVPVFIGERAMKAGLHFQAHILG